MRVRDWLARSGGNMDELGEMSIQCVTSQVSISDKTVPCSRHDIAEN